MSLDLRFVPDVEHDISNAYSWYEQKALGLGEEFIRMFRIVVAEIIRNPNIFQRVYGEYRRALLRRFPFALYYTRQDNLVIVTGVFHCARDPHIIQNTIENRDTE